MKKLVALSLFLYGATAHAVPYNIAVLESLGGDSTAYALNDNGAVVGQSFNSSGEMKSVIWQAGTVQSLGIDGIARGINNSGTVVGETGSADLFLPNGYAYSWTQGGGLTNLGTLGGAQSGAYDINEAGVITGFAWPTGAQFSTQGQGFMYENATDGMIPLGTVSTPTGYSRGHGINDSGEIVGRASEADFGGVNKSDKFTTYWDENQNLDQFVGPGNYSTAEQINNNGVIVGGARDNSGSSTLYATTWDTSGNINFLNDLDGDGSRIWSLNDAGTIVGNAVTLADGRVAAVSFDGTNMVDLNDLVDLTGTGIVSLTNAYDVNANGDIVGVGVTSTGEQRAFVLTAVPVPAAVWLFGSALGALGWMRRKARV
jgi:probable HAF family extracellular repeat protein